MGQNDDNIIYKWIKFDLHMVGADCPASGFADR